MPHRDDILLPILGKTNIVIRAVNGTEKIADTDIVFFYKEYDFTELVDEVEAVSTGETEVSMFELHQSAKFNQMFASLPENDLDKLCLTQHQIKSFVEDNKGWMDNDNSLTFFLFRDRENYFVAMVLIDVSDAASISVDPLGSKKVWDAESRFRVVVRNMPQ